MGRNPSPGIIKKVEKIPEITLTGWVDDTRPYIAKGELFIVPIRIGGGTRMKIYEAMAMGKTVISTTIGAEGLPVKNEQHLVIRDHPKAFSQAVVDFFLDPPRNKEIGSNARKYVEQNFAWQSVARVFSDICETTIQQSK